MQGGPYPTILSAADEIAVEAFMGNQIRFSDIPAVVERTMSRYAGPVTLTFDNLGEIDAWSRAVATEEVGSA